MTWLDDEIVAHTSDITAALIQLTIHAHHHGDQAWLDQHQLFRSASARLLNDQRAALLDG